MFGVPPSPKQGQAKSFPCYKTYNDSQLPLELTKYLTVADFSALTSLFPSSSLGLSSHSGFLSVPLKGLAYAPLFLPISASH